MLEATLDALVGPAMQTWQVPGLALAAVHGDAPPLLRSWGVRDIASAAPVDDRTRFATCSLTKSLTAAGLLLLLEEHGLPLTSRVAGLLPGFALSDPLATRESSVRDLLCHASGLPRHDRIWTPGDLSLQQMVQRMRHLAFSSGLRERFQYNNLGYVVLACVAERLAGRDWREWMTAALLQPLGMRDAGWSPPALADEPNHAHPHPRERDTVCRGELWPVPAPSGGLTASIADMALWLQALMKGNVPGIAPERWARVRAQMTTPWMYADAPPVHPEVGPWHYGLGLCCQHYRGQRMISHTGSMPGWGTLLAYLPEREFGLVVLTNRDPSAVPQLLAFSLFDAVCGLEPVDWTARLAQLRAKALAEEIAEHAREAATRTTAPPVRLADYVGRYSEPAYGDIDLSLAGDRLAWSWRGFTGAAQPRAQDAFLLRENPPARHAEGFLATFRRDAAGQVECLEIPHEPEVAAIAFRRAASH